MDHTFGTSATGILPFYDEYIEYGEDRQVCIFLDLETLKTIKINMNLLEGTIFNHGARKGFTTEYKKDLVKNLKIICEYLDHGDSHFYAFCEILPRKSNRILIDDNKVDQYGIPQVKFEFEWSENEINMLNDATEQAELMLKAAGCTSIEKKVSNLLQEQVSMKWVGRGWK